MANESKSLIQIFTQFVSNNKDANEQLRYFQNTYPKREIIGVSMNPYEPHGWFMIITYKIERS